MKKKLHFAIASLIFISTLSFAQSPGNALQFDGVDDLVSCPLPALFNNINANDMTIEAWVYPQGNVFSRIVFAQLSGTEFVALSTGSTNTIYLYVYAGGTSYSVATSNSLTLNQWTHVAARWTASSHTPEIFFNGIAQVTVGGGTSTFGTATALTIGSKSGGAQYFHGALDEIRIWNTRLSACDISQNMNTTLTGSEPHLVAYYNFNEGTAGGTNTGLTTLTDSAGSYSGTLTNFGLSGTTSNWITSGATINQAGLQPGLDLSVNQNGPTLTAVQSGATYQWIDCDNGHVPVANEVNQSFTASVVGNYGVVITKNGCTDTSFCYDIISVGMNTYLQTNPITIAPNPTMNNFSVNLGNQYHVVNLEISDVTGRLISSIQYHETKNIAVELNQLPGIYFVSISADKTMAVFKLIKE